MNYGWVSKGLHHNKRICLYPNFSPISFLVWITLITIVHSTKKEEVSILFSKNASKRAPLLSLKILSQPTLLLSREKDQSQLHFIYPLTRGCQINSLMEGALGDLREILKALISTKSSMGEEAC